MASKIFNINFNIAAKLASSYIGSFQNASAAVWKLGEASFDDAPNLEHHTAKKKP